MNIGHELPGDRAFMGAALKMAEAALATGEFPVGCVIANRTTVVAKGHRTGTAREAANEIDHAEINALKRLSRVNADADRSALTLYCTMEPCLMCFAATILSGIGRIVYAYEDVMGGGTSGDLATMTPLYRDARLTVVAGVMRQQSLKLFQRFFDCSENTYWADSLLSRYTLNQTVGS